jgi:hypothetical protein
MRHAEVDVSDALNRPQELATALDVAKLHAACDNVPHRDAVPY